MNHQKEKGNAAERELLRLLSAHGAAVKRNQQGYVSGRGRPDLDVILHGKRFHVEAKRQESINIHAALQQAVNDAAPGCIPIVAHRRNREPWLITMRLEDALHLAEGNRKTVTIEDELPF